MAAEQYLNPLLLKSDYSVISGAIPMHAERIQRRLALPDRDGLPFDSLVSCNLGDPQSMGQPCITFPRQVMALVDHPALLSHPNVGLLFPADAIARAKEMLEEIGINSSGAYSPAQGFMFCRQAVADYITARDNSFLPAGHPPLPRCNPECISLSDGASVAIRNVMQMLIDPSTESPKDAMMIPVPHFPLYIAQTVLLHGYPAPYLLEEDLSAGVKKWRFSIDRVHEAYDAAVAAGKTVRAIFVTNPGNPTGHVMTPAEITAVVEFAHARNIAIIADEVYQTNIYVRHGDAAAAASAAAAVSSDSFARAPLEGTRKEFFSFRKAVLMHPNEHVRRETLVLSLHSVSKGVFGECGRRSGYVEILNGTTRTLEQQCKLNALNTCPNINGQIVMAVMVKPPKPGDPSFEQFRRECDDVFASYQRRAAFVRDALNGIDGLECCTPEGALYAFPTIHLPKRFVEYNHAKNEEERRSAFDASPRPPVSPTAPQPVAFRYTPADERYCLELLERTGVVVVPGSGFLQREGQYHFRTTILPRDEQMARMVSAIREFQEYINTTYGDV